MNSKRNKVSQCAQRFFALIQEDVNASLKWCWIFSDLLLHLKPSTIHKYMVQRSSLWHIVDKYSSESNSLPYTESFKQLTRHLSSREMVNFMSVFLRAAALKKFFIRVDIVSASVLSEDEINKIKKYIKAKYSFQDMIIKNKKDATLLYGYVIRFPNKLIDLSFREIMIAKTKVKLKNIICHHTH